jgi:hypothetical protein
MSWGMSFEEQNRIAAARELKRIEVAERLATILGKEFTLNELRFIWSYGGSIPSSIIVTAFEEARTRTKT